MEREGPSKVKSHHDEAFRYVLISLAMIKINVAPKTFNNTSIEPSKYMYYAMTTLYNFHEVDVTNFYSIE